MVFLFPLCSVGCRPGIGCRIPPHTLPLLIFRVHQQGSQGVDGFVVHWYVIGFENPYQLFRQLTNVGETYAMLSSVCFSGVYILFVSPWLYGVKYPRFVACHLFTYG